MLSEPELSKTRLSYAVQARQVEIDLFWRRALFFWGFIGAAFVALVVTWHQHPILSIAVSCFGVICSLCWTLANRGSKYWYEAWEAKVEREEKKCLGKLFSEIEPVQTQGLWLSARRYSVSKLAIALSDFVFVLWFSMLAYQVASTVDLKITCASYRQIAVVLFVLFTAGFALVVMLLTRSKKKRDMHGEARAVGDAPQAARG